MVMWEKCYEMKLGEKAENVIHTHLVETLTRVPGGWLYCINDMESVAVEFIPFDNEFMGKN